MSPISSDPTHPRKSKEQSNIGEAFKEETVMTKDEMRELEIRMMVDDLKHGKKLGLDDTEQIEELIVAVRCGECKKDVVTEAVKRFGYTIEW